jgi:formamidopyrimidine-DNA glycosylase
MPELPEVETVVRGLKFLEGQTLRAINIFDAKVWFESEVSPAAFEGKKLTKVSRRGKYIILRFSDLILIQHLRMTGKMLESQSGIVPELVRSQMGSDGPKAKQIRSLFSFSKNEIIFYDTRRFGTLTAVKNEEAYFAKKKIAPDPILESQKAYDWFVENLQTDRALKAVLLDQSVVAGVGNIYADEALFDLGYHPLMQASKVKRKKELWLSIERLFEMAINFGGSSIVNYVGADGKRGTFSSKLKVYGREGEKCLRCQGRVDTMVVAGRTSHFCKSCQKRSEKKF